MSDRFTFATPAPSKHQRPAADYFPGVGLDAIWFHRLRRIRASPPHLYLFASQHIVAGYTPPLPRPALLQPSPFLIPQLHGDYRFTMVYVEHCPPLHYQCSPLFAVLYRTAFAWPWRNGR